MRGLCDNGITSKMYETVTQGLHWTVSLVVDIADNLGHSLDAKVKEKGDMWLVNVYKRDGHESLKKAAHTQSTKACWNSFMRLGPHLPRAR